MKKTLFQIAVAVMLLMVSCAKDELIDEASENNQLKKGNVNKQIVFYSISIVGDSYPLVLTDTQDGIIMQNGNFSGFFGPYGKIISSLSTYHFAEPLFEEHPFLGNEFSKYFYFLGFQDDGGGATAKIYIATSGKNSSAPSDYFTIEFIRGDDMITRYNFRPTMKDPSSVVGDEFWGGNFSGTVKITGVGGGKLPDSLVGKIFSVQKINNIYAIDCSSGYIKLQFQEI